MRITCGHVTVKRLEYERERAERLKHVRFFTSTACLLRMHHGHAFCDIAAWLHLSLRTGYPCYPSVSVFALPGSVGILCQGEVVKPDAMRSTASV